jgi:hypothetical protein
MTQTRQTELQRAHEAHNALLGKRQKLDAQREAVSDAAIATARQQIAGLEARIAAEEARSKARDACLALPEFRRLGERFDQLLVDLLACYGAIKAISVELRDATGIPNSRGFQLATRNAFVSGLMSSDLQQELVPPLSRRSMLRVVDEYARSCEAMATGQTPREG